METALTYHVGSRVAHPVHGAGTITGIEEKSIGDVSHTYYVIEAHNMELLVPVLRADDVGLRPIRGLRRLRQLLFFCANAPGDEEVIEDYKARQAAVKELIKSGSLAEVAQAIRVLYFLNTRRKLGVVDTRLYESAMNNLATELALASGQELDDAKTEIEESLACMLPTDDETVA